MKNYLMAFFIVFQTISFAQSDTIDLSSGEQIFLPSLDFGYIYNASDFLSGSVIVKTSIEYRFRNNNDVFIRLNYDTHNADYELENISNLTNIIKGTVSFSDVLLGGGYRFGDATSRYFVMMQAGVRFYDYPQAFQDGIIINIENASRNIFTTRLTFGYEYYLNEKSAFTFDLFQNQVWKEEDFWTENGRSFGVALGFITSLF